MSHPSVQTLFVTLCIVTLTLPIFSSVRADDKTREDSNKHAAEARALHESLFVMDSHLDTPALLVRPGFNILNRHSLRVDRSQVDYPRMVDGGLDGGFWVIYSPQGPITTKSFQSSRDTAILRALAIHKMAAANPDKFQIATTSDDGPVIHEQGKRVVYLSIENAYPLGADISLLKTFFDLGVRMLGPVHFRNNQFGDSSTDPDGQQWNGLSPLGKNLIREANRLGMILDGSHGHNDLVRQMIELSETPIVLSHSGATEIYDHPRNVPDDILLSLAETGGVIQMNAFSSYLTKLDPTPERSEKLKALRAQFNSTKNPSAKQLAEFSKMRQVIDADHPASLASFEDYMDHFLYVLKLIGPDHVGVGADWDGGGGLSDMIDVSQFPKVTQRLLEEGYSHEDLEKIWSGNLLRLLKEVEDHAKQSNSNVQSH